MGNPNARTVGRNTVRGGGVTSRIIQWALRINW